MRPVDPAAQALREQRLQLIERTLVWVSASDRASGALEGIGFWDGEANETIRVPDMFLGVAVNRLFYGAGPMLGIGGVAYSVGFDIRPVSIRLSDLAPEVQAAFRLYEPRGAEVQIWTRTYHPETRRPVAVEPKFKGFINTSDITRPVPGGEAVVEPEVVSTARFLTITSGATKSHEAMKRRGDNGRRYKAAIHQLVVPWGDGSVRF